MVMRFGFDSDLGAENYAPDSIDGNYLGAEAQQKAISNDTRKIIDIKVRTLLQEAYALATKIINKNRELHETIANALLVQEEMTQEEFDAFFL
jgi:cell division protease FtsH